MSERSVIKISQNGKKLTRRRLVWFVVVALALTASVFGLWVWSQTTPSGVLREDISEVERVKRAVADAGSRTNRQVKVVSVDRESKTIVAMNRDTSKKETYSYTNEDVFAQGDAYKKMSPSEIASGDTLHLVYRTDGMVLESVWRP